MVSKYLVDANVWIALLDETHINYAAAREFFSEVADDEAKLIGYTSTIRYEVLRGVSEDRLDDAKELLKPYEVFELSSKVADTAADIFRAYPKDDPNRRIDKYQFDILHVACADNYDLVIKSYDGDVDRIEKIALKIRG